MKTSKIKKTLSFGSCSTIEIDYEIHHGHDTRVTLPKASGECLMWISKDSIDEFEKDFLELINKYFI